MRVLSVSRVCLSVRIVDRESIKRSCRRLDSASVSCSLSLSSETLDPIIVVSYTKRLLLRLRLRSNRFISSICYNRRTCKIFACLITLCFFCLENKLKLNSEITVNRVKTSCLITNQCANTKPGNSLKRWKGNGSNLTTPNLLYVKHSVHSRDTWIPQTQTPISLI